MKSSRKADFITIAAFAAIVCLVLPLQTFLGNPGSFPFSFGRLLLELLALFGMFMTALVVLLAVLKKLAPCVLSLLVAGMICVFLESGILSLGLPELNGGPVAELANQMRGCIDAGIWCGLVLLFLIFARRLRPLLHWIALGVLVLAAASLVDVSLRPPVDAESFPRQKESASIRVGRGKDSASTLSYAPQPTVVANVKYSPTRNILVFILDSMPGKVAIDVLATNASLCAKFPGFTAYPNNIGMHEVTKRGVPGLVTGHHYDPAEMSESDYPMTMYATNSFVMVADAAGWNVVFSPDLLPYGAINLPIEKRVARIEKKRARDRFACLRQSTEIPFLSLFDTIAFRLSPFLFKGPILYSRIRHAVKGRQSGEGFWGEATMYPELAARPVNATERPFLGVFHSWGAHPPWSENFAATVTGNFQKLAQLMDAYRTKGLYDKSLIIVTSDHGLDEVPSLNGYPPSASAFLMVKPESASAPFFVSALQTSHARIAPLVKASLLSPPNQAQCAAILHDEHPFYRAEVRASNILQGFFDIIQRK